MVKASNEPCLFCNNLPCTCNGPVAKKKKTAKKSASASVAPKDSIDFTKSEIPKPKQRFKKPKQEERDLSLESALRALLPILSAQDRTRVKRILHNPRPTELDKRLVAWRERNAK